MRRVFRASEEIRALIGRGEDSSGEKEETRATENDEGADTLRRFLILRDLVAEVAPRWKGRTRPVPRHLGRETLELEALKAGFRQQLEAARDVFGQDLWQNPNLQANCFALAEAAAWLKAADSTLGRIAWLIRHAQADEEIEPTPKVALGRRALARCFAEADDRLRRFGEELAHLRRGFYAPQVRAASLLFDRPTCDDEERQPNSCITRPLSVFVVLRP